MIAPTLMSLMGLAVPPEMKSDPLREIVPKARQRARQHDHVA